MNSELLFVYGTLRQKVGHPMHRPLSWYGEWYQVTHMQGRLFDIAGYPGAIESLNPSHRVRGELYRINDRKRLFALLDDFEECSNKFPKPHEYRRKIVTVHTIRGDMLSAWAYIYRRSTTQLELIPDGDYLRFLRLR